MIRGATSNLEMIRSWPKRTLFEVQTDISKGTTGLQRRRLGRFPPSNNNENKKGQRQATRGQTGMKHTHNSLCFELIHPSSLSKRPYSRYFSFQTPTHRLIHTPTCMEDLTTCACVIKTTDKRTSRGGCVLKKAKIREALNSQTALRRSND